MNFFMDPYSSDMNGQILYIESVQNWCNFERSLVLTTEQYKRTWLFIGYG